MARRRKKKSLLHRAASGVRRAVSNAARAPKKWIKRAIKHKGALHRNVQSRYGRRGFTKRGTIKPTVLTKLAREPGIVGRRARFAKELRGFRKRKRR